MPCTFSASVPSISLLLSLLSPSTALASTIALPHCVDSSQEEVRTVEEQLDTQANEAIAETKKLKAQFKTQLADKDKRVCLHKQ